MEVINPQQSRQNDASTGTTGTQEEEEGEGATSDGTEPRQADPETVTAERNGRRSENTGGQTTESDAERIDVVTPSVRDYGATTANVGQNSNQNQFDIAIRYHEELCAIVSDTVSAYCPWFVMHWFFYGATCLIGVIYISEEFTYSKNPFKLAYVSVFLVTHIYMFLFPCCCAAYITDTCGGMVKSVSPAMDYVLTYPIINFVKARKEKNTKKKIRGWGYPAIQICNSGVLRDQCYFTMTSHQNSLLF